MVLPLLLAVLVPLPRVASQEHSASAMDSTVYEMPPGGKPAQVPFKLVANQVRVEATIEGKGPFWLILDTGMPIGGIILFESESVAGLELVDSGQRVGLTGGGSETASTEAVLTQGTNVGLGDLKMKSVSAMILPKPTGFPPGVDGVIGGALFFHYVVRVDMDHERLELFETASWSAPAGACSVPLENVQGKIFTDLRVSMGKEEPVPAHVVVDLGAGHALSLNTDAEGRFTPPEGAIEAPVGRGISGVLLGKLGRIRRVEIGTFAFESVIASFPSREHQRPGGFDFRDGNLGSELLKRFNVTFDYAASRMVLEKSKAFPEPFEREMAGLAYSMEKDGTLSVWSVLPETPAAEAGCAAGDRILSIDGRPPGELGENGVRKALTVPEAEVRLELRRGKEKIEKKLRLRRLV